MAGRLHYTPQSGNSNRAAQSAARKDSPLEQSAVAADSSVVPMIPRQRNVKSTLTLGETRYITVRTLGAFAIPPVPFKTGQRVMTLYTDTLIAANRHIAQGTQKTQDEYFRLLSRLSKLLHKHLRPLGIVRGILWRCGLTRNRFAQCSEQELKDVANFFLQGRMRSSVQLTSEKEQMNA